MPVRPGTRRCFVAAFRFAVAHVRRDGKPSGRDGVAARSIEGRAVNGQPGCRSAGLEQPRARPSQNSAQYGDALECFERAAALAKDSEEFRPVEKIAYRTSPTAQCICMTSGAESAQCGGPSNSIRIRIARMTALLAYAQRATMLGFCWKSAK